MRTEVRYVWARRLVSTLNSQRSTPSHQLVWMVIVDGATHGQATLFREWTPA